jgi:hypothetical protein
MALSAAFTGSPAWRASPLWPRSGPLADSAGHQWTVQLDPSSSAASTAAFLGSNSVPASGGIDRSFRYPDSLPPTLSSFLPPTKFGPSVGFGVSRAYPESAPPVPSVALAASGGIAKTREFNANSEFLTGSRVYGASGVRNETVEFTGSGARPASSRFFFSSPLDRSREFPDSMKFATEVARDLHISEPNRSFPVGYAAAIIIGVLALVLIGACLVIAQTRAQRSSSSDSGMEMAVDASREQEETSIVDYEEEGIFDFVCENPVSNGTDEMFNDQGFSFDGEEGIQQFA